MSTATEKTSWTPTRRTVPASALCFNLGEFEFASSGIGDQKQIPVKLLARTGQPIRHWYWGTVVHDMAGMQLAKDTLPLDYCHFEEEVVGFLNKFDISSGDLQVSGVLVPFAEDDRASEIAFKAKSGVPYEASINFAGGPLRIEELQTGTSATVNGNLVNGPATIIRQWTLRGVAVCPYGADMNTETELSTRRRQRGSGAGESIEVTIFSQQGDPTMKNETEKKPEQLAAQPTEQPAASAAAASPAAVNLTEGAKPAEQAKPAVAEKPKAGAEFIGAFGDIGARWYLEGKSFAEAATEFVAQQKAAIDQLQQDNKQLKEQLTACRAATNLSASSRRRRRTRSCPRA